MKVATSETKTLLQTKGQAMLKDQIADIQRQLTELQESSEVEEKSSAGDKFETHQEMIHQTRNILEKRLSSSKVMLNQLNAVPVKPMESVQEGALFKVEMGNIWVSVPFGKISLEGTDYQLVSPDSPLVAALWDLKQGDSGEFRGKKIKIIGLE